MQPCGACTKRPRAEALAITDASGAEIYQVRYETWTSGFKGLAPGQEDDSVVLFTVKRKGKSCKSFISRSTMRSVIKWMGLIIEGSNLDMTVSFTNIITGQPDEMVLRSSKKGETNVFLASKLWAPALVITHDEKVKRQTVVSVYLMHTGFWSMPCRDR